MLLAPNAPWPELGGASEKDHGFVAREPQSHAYCYKAQRPIRQDFAALKGRTTVTDHSNPTNPFCAAIASQAAPIADPLSFGKGGTLTASNRPLARSLLFYLILRPPRPDMHKLRGLTEMNIAARQSLSADQETFEKGVKGCEHIFGCLGLQTKRARFEEGVYRRMKTDLVTLFMPARWRRASSVLAAKRSS
ncbi:hypothetical protein ACVILL_001016 [Bradyrhizobium sp. USDA 3364]